MNTFKKSLIATTAAFAVALPLASVTPAMAAPVQGQAVSLSPSDVRMYEERDRLYDEKGREFVRFLENHGIGTLDAEAAVACVFEKVSQNIWTPGYAQGRDILMAWLNANEPRLFPAAPANPAPANPAPANPAPAEKVVQAVGSQKELNRTYKAKKKACVRYLTQRGFSANTAETAVARAFNQPNIHIDLPEIKKAEKTLKSWLAVKYPHLFKAV